MRNRVVASGTRSRYCQVGSRELEFACNVLGYNMAWVCQDEILLDTLQIRRQVVIIEPLYHPRLTGGGSDHHSHLVSIRLVEIHTCVGQRKPSGADRKLRCSPDVIGVKLENMLFGFEMLNLGARARIVS